MAGPFDPSNYSLDPTDPSLSLSDQLRLSRDQIAQVNPELAGRLQTAYGQPSVLPTAQPTAPEPQPGENGTPKIGETPKDAPKTPEDAFISKLGLNPNSIDDKAKKALWEQIQQSNPNTPKQTIGNSKIGELLTGQPGGAGGILGLGIQPIDVLAFALGAAITSRMPQSQAIATTMAIAKMPGQMRAAQQKAGDEYIKSIKDYIGMQQKDAENQTAQLNVAEKFLKITKGLSQEHAQAAYFDMVERKIIDPTTQAGQVAGMKAGISVDQLKLLQAKKEAATTGADVNNAISAIAAGTTSFERLDPAIQEKLGPLGINSSVTAKKFIAQRPEIIAAATAQARAPFQIQLIERRNELTPADAAATYIDRKTGAEVPPPSTKEELLNNKNIIALKGPEQRAYKATQTGMVHLDLALDMLDKLGSKLGEGMRLTQNLKTKFGVATNDPDMVAFVKTLGPFSAAAMSAMATAGAGAGGGRSKALIDTFAAGLPGEGDSLTSSFGKLDTVISRQHKEAIASGRGTAEVDALQAKSDALKIKFGIKLQGFTVGKPRQVP